MKEKQEVNDPLSSPLEAGQGQGPGPELWPPGSPPLPSHRAPCLGVIWGEPFAAPVAVEAIQTL